MADESIKFENIDFSYGTKPILKNISFVIHEGETAGIIGPNGAGKTTLILIAMGLLTPQKGRVEIKGKPIEKWSAPDFARYCAYLPQSSHIPATLTVWEAVMLGRTPYLGFLGMAGARDEEVVEESLAEMEIGHLKDRRIGEISGGERQRVILARTLAQEPHCLFLDEPTHSLDMHHQVMLLSFTRRLAEEKRVTVLFVIHDLNLASTFSDRVILLANGEMTAQGTPEHVISYDKIMPVFGKCITIFPRPDEPTRPAILPVRNRDTAQMQKTGRITDG